MKYEKLIKLKNGKMCNIKNPEICDASEMIRNYNLTHEETDCLACYVDEKNVSVEDEVAFIEAQNSSECNIQLCAYIDQRIVGMAGVSQIKNSIKMGHRASYGIGIEKEYWGLGIGKSLTIACIECAKKAGFLQLELEVVADNKTAISLYKDMGFEEMGRNPMGFRTKDGAWQELISMRLAL
ncbi:MAG: GNAT family N-acetyltransferase [Eubacteriales bacterium]|nr:GNAT family N-acetyltransferase [Eubacteriales bacterium]